MKVMKCDRCGNELQRGYAQVHSTLASFLTFWGVSWHNMYFVPDLSPRSVLRVALFRQKRVAFRCPACNVVAVTPLKWRQKWDLAELFKSKKR